MDKSPGMHVRCRLPNASEISEQSSPEIATEGEPQQYNQAKVTLCPAETAQGNTTLTQAHTGWAQVSPDSPVLCSCTDTWAASSPVRCLRALCHSLCQQGQFHKPVFLRTVLQEARVTRIQTQMGNQVFSGLSPESQSRKQL